MSASAITLTADCDGIIHATVTVHDVPNGTPWQVVELWGGPSFFPSSGNDHQASYHAQGTPGATYTVGANVLIGGVRHDASPASVTISQACATTTTVAQTTTSTTKPAETTTIVTVGPTTTTVRLDTALTTTSVARSTTTAEVGTASSVVRIDGQVLPQTGAATWGIGVAATVLVVFGTLFFRIGKWKH